MCLVFFSPFILILALALTIMRTVDNPSPSLSIRLKGHPQTRWRPGTTVTGLIARTESTACPRARVTISLCGESNFTIQKHSGLTRNSYLGRFAFFGGRQTTQVVHRDLPLDIKQGSGGASWEFAITIPSSMNPGSVGTAHYSFLLLSPVKVTAQQLPPVFNFRGFKIGRQ